MGPGTLMPHKLSKQAAPVGARARRKGDMLFCVLLCLIVIAFVLAGLDKLHESDELAPYDTAAYLQQARLINETGGPLVLLARCFSGTYGHANRMPLYIVLLSLLPFGTLKVLAWAKLFTLVLGGAGIVVLFFVARALFGRTVAALASAAMALNTAYLSHSTMVACEVMLAVWVTLAWFFITRLLQGRRVGFWECNGRQCIIALFTVLFNPATCE